MTRATPSGITSRHVMLGTSSCCWEGNLRSLLNHHPVLHTVNPLYSPPAPLNIFLHPCPLPSPHQPGGPFNSHIYF